MCKKVDISEKYIIISFSSINELHNLTLCPALAERLIHSGSGLTPDTYQGTINLDLGEIKWTKCTNIALRRDKFGSLVTDSLLILHNCTNAY